MISIFFVLNSFLQTNFEKKKKKIVKKKNAKLFQINLFYN